MKRITFPFIETKLLLPIITVNCKDGNSFCALVDTGSGSTIIDSQGIKDYLCIHYEEQQEGKQELTGVAGKVEVAAKRYPSVLISNKVVRIMLVWLSKESFVI